MDMEEVSVEMLDAYPNKIRGTELSALKSKSESVASKMNKLTDTLMSNIETAEEMHITGTDIIESVEEKTEHYDLYQSEISPLELLNLENLLDDFKYIRDTLRESSDNARKILSQTAVDICDGKDDLGDDPVSPAEMIGAYAVLNKSLTDNMKMYVQAYKEISNIILNIDKVKNSNAIKNAETKESAKTTQINVFQGSTPETQIINTRDILKALANEDK